MRPGGLSEQDSPRAKGEGAAQVVRLPPRLGAHPVSPTEQGLRAGEGLRAPETACGEAPPNTPHQKGHTRWKLPPPPAREQFQTTGLHEKLSLPPLLTMFTRTLAGAEGQSKLASLANSWPDGAGARQPQGNPPAPRGAELPAKRPAQYYRLPPHEGPGG